MGKQLKTVWWRDGVFVLASLIFFFSIAPAKAEDEVSTLMADTLNQAEEAKFGFGKGSVIVAPIPLKNPALGDGLIVTGGYLFKFDEKSDTSFVGAAAVRTSNGSMGTGIAANLNFDQGRWSVLSMFGRARANYSIYGIGSFRFGPVPLSQEGTFARVGVGYGITDTFTIGVDAQYLDTKIRPNGGGTFPIGSLPGFGIGVRQVLAGPKISFDTRDDTIYPTRGLYASLLVQHGFGLGNFDNSFTRGTAVVKAYLPVGERGVLAVAATGCRASRGAPFFNMCSVGASDKLRGYAAGEYIDNALFSAQAEFRYRLSSRWGVAAFAGASAVGSDFSGLGERLYAGGIGLRYRLSKSFPLDFSIDQAVNADGDTSIYVYIGQPF